VEKNEDQKGIRGRGKKEETNPTYDSNVLTLTKAFLISLPAFSPRLPNTGKNNVPKLSIPAHFRENTQECQGGLDTPHSGWEGGLGAW
jgi:hypothetical protein